MINLNVQFIPQTFEYDCWYASLRMLVKFRWGPNAEPVGHPMAAMEGMLQQSIRTAVREDAQRQGIHPSAYQVRKQLPPSRGLRQDEFQQLAGYNGLAAPLLPPRYNQQAGTGGFSGNQLESLLRIHGPLWCALGYGHIVVAKGVDAQGNVIIHDPQGQANTPYPVNNFNNLLTWQPNCVMFLPSTPNPGAFA